MRRFERIFDDVEPVEEYRAGGYHPVHLDDVFVERYQVLAKLAYGSSSTVWLAEDLEYERKVALKIMKADASQNREELHLFDVISKCSSEESGFEHVLELLDVFDLSGPNGTHLCLVMPFMISDVQLIMAPRLVRPMQFAKQFARQVLLGLNFLHKRDIIHCDLSPANILVSKQDTKFGTECLEKPEKSTVTWLDGVERDESAPRYLVVSQRPWDLLSDVSPSEMILKLGDLGGAKRVNHCDDPPTTPLCLRAPELLKHTPWNKGIDVWALGCLIFELITNEPLFPLDSFGQTKEQIREQHEKLIDDLFGDGSLASSGFDNLLHENLPEDCKDADRESLVDFLHSCLQFEAASRKDTEHLLRHHWVTRE